MPKILVADDSIAVRKVAERLLTEAGLGVALAANGEEAMAYLTKDQADVIVSDVIMPDKSGYEVCEFVRNNSSLASTPVLLISGIVNDEVTKQAEACRADGVLKKPFQGTSLKDKVLELWEKRQSQLAESASKVAAALDSPRTFTATEGVTLESSPPVAMTLSLGLALLENDKLEADSPSAASHALDIQLSNKLKEVEGQLRAEQVRTESLAKRVLDLEAEGRKAKEIDILLEAERSKVAELELKVSAAELQLLRIPQLEASLREEQDLAEKARQEAAALKSAAESIMQLEASLEAERVSAAQLVSQISDLEEAAVRGKNAEAMLVLEKERVSEFQQKTATVEASCVEAQRRIAELEEQLMAEQQKAMDSESHMHVTRDAVMKVPELEALLAGERDRNAVLVKRIAETEQVAVNATKRFDEISGKVSELASWASQLGKGTGEL